MRALTRLGIVERVILGKETDLGIFDEVLAPEAVPDLESIPYFESVPDPE